MYSVIRGGPRSCLNARRVGMFDVVNRSIFVKTENTPNPESLKFFTGEEILPPSLGTGMVCTQNIKSNVQT